MSDTNGIRRNLVGGGVVTLAMVVVLLGLVGVPADAAEALPIVWFAVGGATLLVAGRRDRVSIGGTSVGWPRVAAVGLAVLAVGSSTIGFVRLLTGPGGWGLLQAGVSLLVSLVLGIGALECWLGGVAMDEATFAVD